MRELIVQGERVREGWRGTPETESQGMKEYALEGEFAGLWGPQPLLTVYTSAAQLLYAAEDEMQCLARLFDADPTPVYGHLLLARGALEASSRAWWLLETRVGVRGALRVAWPTMRLTLLGGSCWRRADLVEQPTAAEKLATMLDEALRRGFAHRTRPGGIELEERKPGYRRMIEMAFEASPFGKQTPGALYAYFSAVVHGQPHGLLQSLERDDVTFDLLGGAAQAPMRTDSSEVVAAMAIVVASYTAAVDEQIALLGWSKSAWQEVRSSAFQTITTALRAN